MTVLFIEYTSIVHDPLLGYAYTVYRCYPLITSKLNSIDPFELPRYDLPNCNYIYVSIVLKFIMNLASPWGSMNTYIYGGSIGIIIFYWDCK